jgi:hypothetical protein
MAEQVSMTQHSTMAAELFFETLDNDSSRCATCPRAHVAVKIMMAENEDLVPEARKTPQQVYDKIAEQCADDEVYIEANWPNVSSDCPIADLAIWERL